MALICCESLSLGYEGREIVSGLSFSVGAGDYLCVLGENGSGKSTLMRTVLGLQPPLAGKVRFEEGMTRGELGYLPQQTEIQRDFPASVWEIVLSGCQGRKGFHPFYDASDKRLARENIEKLGIAPLARRCFPELSGGQQQRVLLARALCATRRLLLLDEPVSGLDPRATAEFYELVGQLNRKDGVAVMMISHDVHLALRWSRHILHIGKTCFFGTRDAYRRSDVGRHYLSLQHGEVYE